MFIAEEPAEITIDRIDRKILRLLQDDGRISNVALAKRVGLSNRMYGAGSQARAGRRDRELSR